MAWRPRRGGVATALRPLAWLYALLAALHRAWWRHVQRPVRLPVPVVVVGNVVVGGSGKTPVVIALVQTLRAAGWNPGVVSRGYGRASGAALRLAAPDSTAEQIGDEPLLIGRRTGAPLAVGARRVDAAPLLLARHPEVDIIVSDDGLQHHALAHDLALVVFDDRGAGNGLLLPAGPLREPVPKALPARRLVVYTGPGGASTRLPGTLAPVRADRAVALQAWWRSGEDVARQPPVALKALDALRSPDTQGAQRIAPPEQGQTVAGPQEALNTLHDPGLPDAPGVHPLIALAGIGEPSKFFATLTAAGLRFVRQPMPDHARYDRPPWPAWARDVVTTEKDAVKLARLNLDMTRVWVVPLDLTLPPEFVTALLRCLPRRCTPR